ncbi:tRNA-dihydrouridine(47) synthase [NAD(P)(+)]-like isoform X1 [Xenia sp. Carnegie-2017]|uniref:tRNA-dihydrouridine(47) synthase [NAD(P)(+)]-like isoform X1 n=1 Tax=Xenia sp. Carnegie-2017 TaxID=2897299 RepID=UPI001F03643B|nr:tRNA-dihydrouridine(47) synthase [NAD(P)(+)]-like isoform X1 [Xenia sp. Carnegie-2017]
MNKKRPRNPNPLAKDKICLQFLDGKCKFGDKCYYSHDLQILIKHRQPDIPGKCRNFELYGNCPYSITCRFGKQHLTEDFINVTRECCNGSYNDQIMNILSKSLQVKLRKKQFLFPKSDDYMKQIKESNVQSQDKDQTVQTLGAFTNENVIRMKPAEKKKIDFSGKLYLAPLTTVGNLPFRRLCKSHGADVTCGEMAMCTKLLQGTLSEWALIKRHSCEDIFGVQLCGSFPDTMSKCAELLQDQAEIDFIDVNVGCPIDLVFNKGAGSALMERSRRFREIVCAMNHVLDIPLTVKMRTGVHDKKWNALQLIPKIRNWGASLVTLHGRSREQRYTKSADWNYIHQCAQAASPMPLFGNGDIFSFVDVERHRQETGVSGVMIARGALIKPWIFTEIKEKRHWDISSTERLDIVKEYVNYGLEHWGSDTEGVERTRRFLLEWLSFLYRIT